MAIHGEIVKSSGQAIVCEDCGESMPLKVLKSNAYYIGYSCRNCGPYSRESSYFGTRQKAEEALAEWAKNGSSETARDTEYHPGTLHILHITPAEVTA